MTSEQQMLILGCTATTDSLQKQRQSGQTADSSAGLSLSTDIDTEPDSSGSDTTDFDEAIIFQLGRAQSTVSKEATGGDEVGTCCDAALKSKRPAPEGRKASTVANDISEEDCIFMIRQRPSSAAPMPPGRHLTEAQAAHGRNQEESLLLSDAFVTSSATSDRTAPFLTTTTAVNAATAEESTTDDSEQSIQLSKSLVSRVSRQSKKQPMPAGTSSRGKALPTEAEETATAYSPSTIAVPPWSIGVSDYATSASPGDDALWKFRGNVAPQMTVSGRLRSKTDSTEDAMLIFGQNWASPLVAAVNPGYPSERTNGESEVTKRRLRLVPAEFSGAEKTEELTPRNVALHLPDRESQGASVSAPSGCPHAPEVAPSRMSEAAAQLISIEFAPPSYSSREASLRTSDTLADSREQLETDWWSTKEPLPKSPKALTVRVDSKDSGSPQMRQDDRQRFRPHETSESCSTCQVYATLSLVNATSACCSQQPTVKTDRRLKFKLPHPIAKDTRLGRPKSSTKLETALAPPQLSSNLHVEASHSSQKLTSHNRDEAFSIREAKEPNSKEPPSPILEGAGTKMAANDSTDRRRLIPGGDVSVKDSNKDSRSRSKKERKKLHSTRTAMPVVEEVTAKQPGRKSHSRQRSLSQLGQNSVLNASQGRNGHPKGQPSGRHAPVNPSRSRSRAAKTTAPAASSTAGLPTIGAADRASESRRSRPKEDVVYLVKRQPSGRTLAQPPKDPLLPGIDGLASPSYIRDQWSSGGAQEAMALWTENQSPKMSTSCVSETKVGTVQPLNSGNVGGLASSVTERPLSKDSVVKLPAESSKADSKRPQPKLPLDFIAPPESQRPPPSSGPSSRSTVQMLLQSDAAKGSKLSAMPDPVKPCSTQGVERGTQPQVCVGWSSSAVKSHVLLQTLQWGSRRLDGRAQQQQVSNSSGALSPVRDETTSGTSNARWDGELLEVTSEVD